MEKLGYIKPNKWTRIWRVATRPLLITPLLTVILVVFAACGAEEPTPLPAATTSPRAVTASPRAVTAAGTPTTQLASFKELHIGQVGIQTNEPNQISFVFSLRDED